LGFTGVGLRIVCSTAYEPNPSRSPPWLRGTQRQTAGSPTNLVPHECPLRFGGIRGSTQPSPRHVPVVDAFSRVLTVCHVMLQDVYDRLLLHRLDPRWVSGEVHVEVFGRRFMITDRPGGLAVRTLVTTAPVTLDHPDDVFAAMGLGINATGGGVR
jgi:hypothetical protein